MPRHRCLARRYGVGVDHESYARDIARAVELFESGQFQEAASAWRSMAADPGLPLRDRALQLINLATTYTKLNRPVEAEAAYDEGIAIEDQLLRGRLRESKAVWLAERGRVDEAAALYESLLRQYWLDSSEIRRCEQNLALIRDGGLAAGL